MTYTLFRVGKGKNWHYRFQVAGVRMQKSTGEAVKRAADLVAAQAYAVAMHPERVKRAPTLLTLAGLWLDVHGRVSSASHLASVDCFRRLHLYDLRELPLDEITTERVELARNEHLSTHAPASANHWLKVLKLLMKWAITRNLLSAMPWKVKEIKVQKRPRATLPIALTKPWLEALDDASQAEPSIGTAVRLMLGCGLREMEAAGARWAWLDWERGTYTPGMTKGREAEPVPVPGWLLTHLRAVHDQANGTVGTAPNDLIAPSRKGGQHGPGFARKAFGAANAACSVERITPHRLRGTFATMLSEEGVGVQTIQQVMRHKSAMTTIGYLEKNVNLVALAQEKISKKIDL